MYGNPPFGVCIVLRYFDLLFLFRLFATETSGRLSPKPKQQQHDAFDMIYEICNEMMDIQVRLSTERQQDERNNRMATLLLVLSNAAMASPVCEKKALLALCLVINEKNVEADLVLKVRNMFYDLVLLNPIS